MSLWDAGCKGFSQSFSNLKASDRFRMAKFHFFLKPKLHVPWRSDWFRSVGIWFSNHACRAAWCSNVPKDCFLTLSSGHTALYRYVSILVIMMATTTQQKRSYHKIFQAMWYPWSSLVVLRKPRHSHTWTINFEPGVAGPEHWACSQPFHACACNCNHVYIFYIIVFHHLHDPSMLPRLQRQARAHVHRWGRNGMAEAFRGCMVGSGRDVELYYLVNSDKL